MSRSGLVATLSALALLAGCGAAQAPAVSPLAAGPSAGPGAPAAPPSTAGPVSCAARTYDRLDDEQRYAQLLVIGVPAGGVSAAARSALTREPGGIILTDGESASAEAVTRVVTSAQATGGAEVPLLVSADQEGGQVQELEGPGFPTMPSALGQGRDPDGLRAKASGWGRTLRDVGVTVNLAPVADVVNPELGEQNAPVGRFDRQYGDDVATASAGVRAFVAGMREADVAPTLKHFPGLGEVRQNTDFAGGVVDSTTSPGSASLRSFAAGIDAGAPLVMMSSARYTRIDPGNRALFSSRVMNDLLRGQLGFDGVIMTDDVGAAAALADTPVGARATRFIAAGGDLVLTIRPGDLVPMLDAITAAAREPAFAARAQDAVRRVLTFKELQGVLTC